MSATACHGANTDTGQGGGIKATLGGTGTVPAWSQPQLHLSAPAGIALLTPEHHILAAGKHLTIATGHDTNFVAQGNHSLAVKDGLAIFTAGQATDKQKPNQETGIHLHAASGAVSLQSQSGKTTAAADKKVTFASTTGKLTAGAKQKILATAQGAYLKIEGGNIELHAPKKVEFKASKKEWTGPKSAAVELPSSPSAGELNLAQTNITEKTSYSQRLNVAGLIGGDPQNGALYANMPYEAYNEQGQKIAAGQLSVEGTTGTIRTPQPEKVKVLISQGDWLFFQDVNHL
ncbi:hypothetical protein SDC9_151412 [bioreactor metagenome]|uniref:DUF2345 domain-containing protein n=1 Tax=bioreactor metagenome TaxID=1076179 RepID=A0A645ERU9_9ZZZZ